VEQLMPVSTRWAKEIRLDGWSYQVIGVGKKKGKTLDRSLDNCVMIPITAYLKQYGPIKRTSCFRKERHAAGSR